jgi:RNA polymerase sigma-70 factor, ECF subfamily
LEDSAPDVEETVSRTQAREKLERALENLPIRLRAVFRLCVFEGLKTSEVAATLDIPEGTVKAPWFRACAKVIAMMRQALGLPRTRRAAASEQ